MHRLMEKVARIFALLGGTVLSALVVLTCLSVFGRTLNTLMHSDLFQTFLPDFSAAVLATGIGPINGDFELVEAGIAFTIFAFLPLCQINGAHASVDIFTSKLPRTAERFLRTLIDVIFAAVLVIIAWQLFQGMLSKLNSGQTTFLLQFPLWWAYAFSLSGAAIAAILSIYIAMMRLLEFSTGREILPPELEADH